MNAVEHDAAGRRFSFEVDGHRAVLDYALDGRVMTITHTGVPQPIGGRGVAAELMRSALLVAGQAGWTVVPECSYAAAYLRRHTDAERTHQEALLDEALDESFPASDPPAVGGSS